MSVIGIFRQLRDTDGSLDWPYTAFRCLGHRCPLSFEGVMPVLQNVIEIISRKPQIAEGSRVVEVALSTLERDQTNAIRNVKLENVAAVVESLISLGSPRYAF